MALLLQNLKKQYIGPDGSTVPVVNIASFELAGGEQVALMGGSGTGKTTLLHLIAGIVAPDSGKILYSDSTSVNAGAVIDVARLSEANRDVFRGRHIGYI